MRFPDGEKGWLVPIYVLLCLFGALPQLLASTTPEVSAGADHSVGLNSNGSLVAVGLNQWGECNVTEWGSGFVQIATGLFYTVALKAAGTVVAGGLNDMGQCNVSQWAGIAQISAGAYHTLGLKKDGTVVCTGYNGFGQCNVAHWGNTFVQVVGGSYHTVALRGDGTVVAGGDNDDGQCNVSQWAGIDQISAGGNHTLGLKQDGTVVCTGYNDDGQCNVGQWKNIVQVSGGTDHTIGLKKDGTVVCTGSNYSGQCNIGGWTNIIQVTTGSYYTLGLKANGTVVATGRNDYGQINVGSWNLAVGSPKNVSLVAVYDLLLSGSDPGSGSSCPLIPNGNFEAGAASWTQSATSGYAVITNNLSSTTISPYSGSWLAWTGGVPDETRYIQQQVTVPSACPVLTFYQWISSEDSCGYDFGYVRINGTNLLKVDLCSQNTTNGWVKKMVDLRAYANRSITVQFLSTTDSSLNSSWFIDNVAFEKLP